MTKRRSLSSTKKPARIKKNSNTKQSLPSFEETITTSAIIIEAHLYTERAGTSFETIWSCLIDEDAFSNFEAKFIGEVKRAIDGLDKGQRKLFFGLLTETENLLCNFRQHSLYKKRLTKLSNEQRLKEQQSNLKKKVSKAKKVLEELLSYAKSLDVDLGRRYARKAKECLDSLNQIGGFQPVSYWQALRDDLEQWEYDLTVSQNPIREVMAILGWFFVCECGLSKQEAQIRVALIRNSFWTTYVNPITDNNIKLGHAADASKGCSTVRSAMDKFPQYSCKST